MSSKRSQRRSPLLPTRKTIRIMSDGPGLPLWTSIGRVPDQESYLRDRLGISPQLAADLRNWGNDRDLRPWGDGTDDLTSWDRDLAESNRHGEELRDRLANELGPNYEVVLKPENYEQPS